MEAMTGPEQHAATVRDAIWGYGRPPFNREAALAALDELVALAGRAGWLEDELDECDKRADKAEARADDLQREVERLTLPNIARDQLPMLYEQARRDALDYQHAYTDANEQLEQARREADQLRAALEAVQREAGRASDVRANRTRIIGNVDMIARAALAGAPSGPSEADQLRERCPLCTHEWRRHDPEDGKCDAGSDDLGECPCGRDLSFHRVRNAAISLAALAGVQADNKDSA